MSQVYVARKSCGCIVAAFPTNIDKAVKGELLKQLAKGGYDIDQTTEGEVRLRFEVSCVCNRPPLLSLMEDASEGIDQQDIDAAATEDLSPDGNADEMIDELDEEADEDPQENSVTEGSDSQPEIFDQPVTEAAEF